MTDFYIAKDGTSGGAGTVNDPVLTVAQVVALSGFTQPSTAHTLIFRGGTYSTELALGDSPEYLLKFVGITACNIKAATGETVIFETPYSRQYLLGYTSVTNNTGAELTLTIDGIDFRNQSSTNDVYFGFFRFEPSTSAAGVIHFVVKNSSIVQQAGENNLANGVVYSASVQPSGSNYTLDNCVIDIKAQHVIQIRALKGDVTIKDCDITFSPPDDAVVADVDFPFFLQHPNNAGANATFKMEGTKVTYNCVELQEGQQVFQLDYINEVRMIDNTLIINNHANENNVNSLGEVIRTYNRPDSTTNVSGRALTHFEFSKNVVIRRDGKGDLIHLSGPQMDAGVGSKFIFNDNDIIVTNDILRTQDALGKVAFIDSSNSDTIHIKRNKIRNHQDGFFIRNSGETEVLIEGNLFENCGENASVNYLEPKMIELRDVGTGTNNVHITDNTFDIGQHQTCLYLSDNSDTTTKAIVEGNTFIKRDYHTSTGTNFCVHYSGTGGDGTQHSFVGNQYLNMENLRTTRFVVYGGNVKTLAQGLAYDSEARTSNAIKTLGAKSLVKPRLTKILGT
tara:strand:- start:49 stop:1743 length:1695 start_codon:yes stop_codon:yes gene_type:complete